MPHQVTVVVDRLPVELHEYLSRTLSRSASRAAAQKRQDNTSGGWGNARLQATMRRTNTAQSFGKPMSTSSSLTNIGPAAAVMQPGSKEDAGASGSFIKMSSATLIKMPSTTVASTQQPGCMAMSAPPLRVGSLLGRLPSVQRTPASMRRGGSADAGTSGLMLIPDSGSEDEGTLGSTLSVPLSPAGGKRCVGGSSGGGSMPTQVGTSAGVSEAGMDENDTLSEPRSSLVRGGSKALSEKHRSGILSGDALEADTPPSLPPPVKRGSTDGRESTASSSNQVDMRGGSIRRAKMRPEQQDIQFSVGNTEFTFKVGHVNHQCSTISWDGG